MKRFSYSILFLAFAITGCTSKNEKKAPVNIEKTALQAFTDTVQLDTFKIVLKGDESKNMSLLFTITSYKGVQIYKKEIKAEELLKSYLASADLKKEDEKIKFLNDEVNFFFEEEHFLIPAITEQEKPDNNTPDKAFYEELKGSKLNGFDYRLGKDTKIYIAWSAKDQKVKIYYKCC
ncbi:hypothetical protein [Pedobacter boryungensis]|uniref:Lipoprotein n=1 Tax=Pedobacter boryungensis TaxID=869962 RepID=A0ABX2D9D9_9SPHI|nr:hypothetical protein [Pedobacter boryungensis]NQX30673.1 hypothetical protein [Pedobacter boryungensis]